MSYQKLFFTFVLISISTAGGFLIGQKSSFQTVAQNTSNTKTVLIGLFKSLKAEGIREVIISNDEDDKTVFLAIKKLNEPPVEDSSFTESEKLLILDENGKILYEHKDVSIGSIRFVRLLAPNSSELVIETNSGGTDDFLKILSYKNGRYKEVIDETETQMRGGYFDLVQYRTGMKTPYFKPSQLIVINQIGGADENPAASVFRSVDNKFQKVGEIKMQVLGDFIENQIRKKKSAN